MKRRNSIAVALEGYTVSGMFATTSAIALVSRRDFVIHVLRRTLSHYRCRD